MMVSIMAHQQGDLHGSEAGFPNTQIFLLISTHSLSFLIYRAGHTERICFSFHPLQKSYESKQGLQPRNGVFRIAYA
jgi:hypothetical protein